MGRNQIKSHEERLFVLAACVTAQTFLTVLPSDRGVTGWMLRRFRCVQNLYLNDERLVLHYYTIC